MGNHHFLLFLFGTLVLQTVINGQHVCDFDKDLCNWNTQKSLDIAWKRKQGKLNKQSFPDHTTGSGYYLHLEYQNLTEKNVAQISMPAFLQMDKNYCLSFYYYMSGKFDKALYIYRYSNDTELPDEEAIALYGSQVSGWNHFRKPIKTGLENQLMFEAHLEGPSDIAIDDVQLEEGNCQELNMTSGYDSLDSNPATSVQSLPFKCNFEQKALCGFIVKSGIISWKQGHGRRSYLNHGPREDHTFRTGSGKYLYSSPHWRVVKKEAVLVSPKFSGKDQSCLQFWYNMYGRDVNKLEVIIQNKTVWYAVGDQGFGWKVAYVSIKPGQDFNITFNAWNSYGADGYIALDDIHLQQGKCSRPDVCNFEGAMCSWTNTKTDSLDWVETKGSGTKRIGPHADHTHGTNKGTYLFLDAKKSKSEDTRALLSSEAFSMRVKAKCLHFWYHMKGNVGQLRVYKQNEKKKEMLWSLIGDQGSTWNYASVEIRIQPDNFYLVIEGIIGLNNTGGIAIDDLAINSIQCQTTPSKANLQKPVVKTTKKSITSIPVTIEPGKVVLKCNFPNNICEWSQGHDDSSDWILDKSKKFGGHGPTTDHTTGTNGFYMNLPSKADQKAHLHSPVIKPVAGHQMCLSFWYYMHGPDIESLKVYISKTNLKEKTVHWMRSGTQGNQWKQGKLLILQTQPFKISFEGKVKKSSSGNIGLDDILLIHGSCNELTTEKPDVVIPLTQRNCNFETNDLCGFSVQNTTNFHWSHHSGSTDTIGTGPTNDHTLNSISGHYMYVSAMEGTLTATSSLISPLYQDTDSVCLQFYYHMYGDGIGTLDIYTQISNTTNNIYHISGNQGNKWQVDTATIDISTRSRNSYRVIFKAVKGPNQRGDIAVDDISFTLGPCSSKGDCDFEDSNCLWTNVQNTGDNFDWIRTTGSTSGTNNGPKVDHTKNRPNGYYQYIKSSKGTNSGRAWLASPLFQPLTTDMCLQFWFTINGNDTTRLSVVTVAGTRNITIWQLKGNVGNQWMQGQISLPRIDKPYTVVFEGSNENEEGIIALDDITFTNEPCITLPNNANVNHVITTDKPVGSTSPITTTSLCTFANNLCGWSQDKSDDGDWKIGSKSNGPKSDHTGDGHYIYSENFYFVSKTFRLISPDFQATGPSCVTFWYNKYGYSSNPLRMYIKEGLNMPSSPVLALNEYPNTRWEKEMYTIHINNTFNVIFEAKNYLGVTAIDDVSITPGTCKNDFNSTISCDFEDKGICGFKPNSHLKKTWVWHQGSTPSFETGPLFDHTYKSNKGHYMFVEGSNTKPNSKAQLLSPVINLNSSSCVQFYFNMRGNVGMLTLYLLAGKKSFLWNRFGHQHSNWQLTSVQINTDQHYQIIFQAIIGGKHDGDIAIDDFKVHSGQCKKQGNCNFEDGICDWEMSSENDFDWIIQKATRLSQRSGPITDHTRKQGHYLLAKSNNDQAGSVSKLVSTDFDPTSVNCLHLWYNIYGKTPATLTIYKQAENTSILWQLRNEYEGNWKEARVPVSNTSEVFSIVIEVTSGKSSYVAIDDTRFDKMHDCPRKPSSSFVTHSVDKRAFTTKLPTHPVTENFKSCSFTNGFCGWQQLSGNRIKWKLKKGSTSTKDTGPIRDHTTGRGAYIYIETSNPIKSGDSTHLISPTFKVPTSQEWCLSFWYHMYGVGIGTLSVVYRSNSVDTVAWQKRKSQGRKWLQGKINIKGSQAHQIIFQANKGKNFFGDIALDDIKILSHSCAAPTTSLLTLCDFESTCHLFENVTSSLNWQLTKSHQRPRIPDHTYNSLLGDYIYVKLDKSKKYSDAKFNMPIIKNRTTCLSFFHRSLGSFTGRLTVFKVINDKRIALLQIEKEGIKNEWTFAELEVQSYTNLQLKFYVLSGSKPEGGIAIDDLSLKNGHCNPPTACTFEEEHLCHWKNADSNIHDWTVHSGGTASSNTGPIGDHTTTDKAGSYVYIEASDLKKYEKVRMVSQQLTNNGYTPCFSFWYNMNGEDIDHLNVYIQGSDQQETLMWSLKGHQAKTWQNGMIPLLTSKKEYRIILEGSVNSFKGDIAIDDIYTSPHSCSFYPSLAQAYFPTTHQRLLTTTMKNLIDTDTLFTCTFENGLCNWQQSLTDDFQWQLHQGYTPAKSIGPQGDHTTGSGHYLYIDTNGQTVNSKAQLYFLISSKSNGTRCLKFWYNMRGQHIDSLNAYVQYGTSSNPPIWTRQHDQGPNWQLAQIDFQEVDMADMKIIIEGKKGGNYVGNIAIDDISITSDSCHESYGRCDFESRSLCGYTLDTTADFRWKWQSAYVSQFSTAPTKDHTYGSRQGHYMYISQKSHKVNQIARLISPEYGVPTEDQCVQFYYNIYGRNVGSLNIKLRIHDTKIYDTNSYLEIKGDQRKGWLLGMVEVPKLVDNKFQIIFEGVIGKGRYGDIAIDDIEIKSGECEIGGDCDFDHGRCSWLNMASNRYNWLLGSGSTISSNTGPVSDHTLQNEKGFYLFIDATFLKKEEKTHFISRMFPALYSEKRCFTFWYSMNGDGIGILKILTKFDTGTNVTIWELSRNQGSEWLYGQAPIQAYTPYQIIIEVTRGRSFDGDIAIDDILFKDSDCSVSPHFATPNDSNSVIPTGEPPTNAENTKPFNCTFDAGLCGWSQDPEDDFNWTEMKGATPSYYTGPHSDHTGNNGYYLYIEASNQRYHQKARLMSPLVKSVGMVCMSVYYSMYGSDIKDFNIYITSGGNTPQLIFTRSGSRGRYWFQAQINFQTNSPFNVILEAVRGKGPQGDIAIDDVTIHEGLCSRQSTIGLGKFFNFERRNSLIQRKDDDFDWYLGSGSSSRFSSHPRKDHTYKTSRGHYMYLKSTSRVNPGNKAILSTPIYFSNKLTICVTFWYYIYGKTSGTLRVQYLSEKDQFKSPKSLWMRKDNQGNEWNEANINIEDHADQHIKIEFVGIAGPGYSLNVAIDDVLISNKACTVKKDECHFENGKCEWQNKNTGDFDWVIGSGKYTTLYGPSKDHTFLTAAGKYLYLEPTQLNKYDSSVSQTNEEAILESQPFPPPTKQKCFEFYYYINKAENSSLQIFSNENEGDKKLLWQLSSNQGNNWMKGQTNLENIANSFRLMVKGIRGPRYAGDIALDDMKLTSTTPCKIMPAQASPTVTPKTTESPVLNIPGFNCTFDKDICGWKNNPRGRISWKRIKGSTSNPNTGPSSDHTGGGYYLYISSSFFGGLLKLYADLRSPTFSTNQETCISFYYHMFGVHINSLQIFMIPVTGPKRKFWGKKGPQDNKWLHGTAKLPLVKLSYIIFEASSGNGKRGDIAIDDVTIYPGECQEDISLSPVDCDFERSDNCHYFQDKDVDFSWKKYYGHYSVYPDHTKHSIFGGFMGSGSSKVQVGKVSRLWTPRFTLENGRCLTFWYHMFGSRINTLNVHATSLKDVNRMGAAIWSRRGSQSNTWLQEFIQLPNFMQVYVIFESINGGDVIGIDDVKLLKSCPEPGDCHFELNACGWKNKRENTIFWERVTGQTIYRREHRIIKDHTYNASNSYMMYISVSHTKSKTTGNFISVSLDPPSDTGLCVKFWYIVYGSNIGNLSVLMQTTTQNITMWKLSGSQNTAWSEGSFYLKTDSAFTLVLRADIEENANGYIAIDDINYYSKYCVVSPIKAKPLNQLSTTRGPMTTISTTTSSVLMPGPYDCTFERRTFCNWTQSTSNIKWILYKGSNYRYDPHFDHTTGKSNGYFALFRFSRSRFSSKMVKLLSPPIQNYTLACFQFWFYMFGNSMRSFSVHQMSSNKVFKQIWYHSGTLSREWYPASITVGLNENDKIAFQVELRRYLSGSIALDDIKLTPGHCKIKSTCGFEEENLCQFLIKKSGQFYWKVRDKKAPAVDTQILPKLDHTSHSIAGHYMYLRNIRIHTGNAYLYSKVQRNTSGSCVSFWYNIGGSSDSMRFSVFSVIAGQFILRWRRSSRTNKEWNQAEITVKSSTHWQVAFYGYITRYNPSSYVVIDDVKISHGSCPMDGDCDFEKDMCTWSNSQEDSFDWLLKKASEIQIGPKMDHSEHNTNGHYVYISTKWPTQPRETAVLVSDPIAPSPHRRCLTFWYFIKGYSVGDLEVGYQNESVIWRVSGNQGNQWLFGSLPLNVTNQYKKMTFTGSAGRSSLDIIAIDEISFDLNPCGFKPYWAKNVTKTTIPSTTPTSPPSTFKPNSKFDCTFENGYCSWTQSQDDVFNWQIHQGRTPSYRTGPNVDHTYGTKYGHYIYIESSLRQLKDTAILTSVLFSKNMNYTLQFYYHMFGATVGGLNVTMTLAGQQESILLWTQQRSHSRNWLKAEFLLPPQKAAFTVSFVGIIGRPKYGDIAIDDISVFTNKQMEAPLNCTFETSGICNFTTLYNGKYHWKKLTRGGRYPSNAPKTDHTDGTPYGHYMVFENLYSKNKNSTALLMSPTLKTSVDICMSFFYHMHNLKRSSMNVYQQIGNQRSSALWSGATDQGTRWVKAQVTLRANKAYEVVFEGILHSYGAYVAVDDITSEIGECPDPGDTDFEKDMGTWLNEKNNNIDWIRATGNMPYRLPHPPNDHTMNTTKGYYIFLSSSWGSHRTGIIRSQVLPATSLRCLHFWFYLFGSQPGGIKVYFVDEATGNKTAIWSLSTSQKMSWNYAQVGFAWENSYYVEFEGTINKDHGVYTAIDDIMFTNDFCTVQPLEAETHYKFVPKANTTSTPLFPTSDLDCTFQKDFCKWTHNKSDDFYWIRNHGRTDSGRTGPVTDHTYGNATGYYIYIETSSPRHPNDTASLISPKVKPTSNGCLRFWYHMFGSDVDTLTVYTLNNVGRLPLWRKKGTIDAFWHQALIKINIDTQSQVVLEGRSGRNYHGDISIDDISFSYKQCPSSSDFFCGFESPSICGFVQSKYDKFDWKRNQGRSHTRNSGPTSDHTFGTEQGHYMYIVSTGHSTGDNAVLKSPNYKSTGGKCANFWFHMHGRQIGSLNVYLKTAVSNQLLWTRYHMQGNFWSLAQVKINVIGTFHLEFEAITESGSQGNIAIDDFSLTEGQCPKSGNIDFEKGLTTWMNSVNDEFDWQIGSSIMYGPRFDHTLKTSYGSYLFLRAEYPYKAGDKAILISEYLDGSMHQCMSFWYSMHGPGVGSLKFVIVQLGSNITSWILTGSQSAYWAFGRFPIASNKPFQIIIEGVRGTSNRINFAIDDIEFTNSKCSVSPRRAGKIPVSTTSPPTTVHQLQTTPTPTKYDCDFENNMCSWVADKKVNNKWVRAQGPSGSSRNGPTNDHTHGTKEGWYIMSKPLYRLKRNSKARIIGPSIPHTQTRCLNFWYHMYGAYINQLNVNITQGGISRKLWMKTGDQGNMWRQAFINLDKSAYKNDYKIIFEVVSGVYYRDYIALDDIRFTLGACHENNPTFCDFESADKCNYTHSSDANFEWTWHHGRTPSSQTGPTVDHTMGTSSGHYFYIETSNKNENQTARLISPQYQSDKLSCLHFFYFMYGVDVKMLNVYQVFNEQYDELNSPIWSQENSQGPNWIEGTATLSALSNYSIVFEGISGKSYRGDIAIDDVFQTDGSCQTPGFCDFENGLCNWRNDKFDNFDWLIGQGQTLTSATGPIYDHTLTNAKGHYIYIESSSPSRPGDIAHLLSEHFRGSNKPTCLKFWYQMYGKDINSLNVLVRKSYGSLRRYDGAYIWMLSGNSGQKWFKAQVNVEKKYTTISHQFIFEAIRGNGSYGDIALDDVSVSRESCLTKPIYANPEKLAFQAVSCAFDLNLCQWQRDPHSALNWTLTGYYKPIESRTGSGSYIYIKSFQNKKGSRAVLHTPYLGPTSTDGNCLSFWYYMYGSNIGSLNIYMLKLGRKMLLWTKKGTQENQWNYAHLNIINDYNYQIFIEAVVNGRSTGMMALDDIFMNTNACPNTRSCDFEVNNCGWTNQLRMTNIWRRSAFYNSFPDHTSGTKTGHYIYAKTLRYGTKRTISAAVLSPSYPPTSKSCLRFWYHMSAQTSSQLQLYIKIGILKRKIWERYGDQGNMWWQGHANIVIPNKQLGRNYQLQFQTVQVNGHSESIALDDIEHMPGPCNPNDMCDFEQDTCGFTNLAGDDFDWIVLSGSKQNFATGPTEDHTTNSPSGHYMYIDTRWYRNQNDKAWLSSWENEPTNATCVSFWYHMYGEGMGDLNVLYRNNKENRTVWHETGNQGNIWLLGNFTVISKTSYVIIFEGVRGKTYHSDIALDDIRFQDGSCDSLSPIQTTTVAPIKQDVFFQCNFEYSLCGWQIDSTTNAEFMISYGIFSYKRGGPVSDHTKNNRFGQYLLMNNSMNSANRTARFISTDLHITQPICITFWYYMRIYTFGQLNVYVHNDGENTPPMWTRVGTQGYHWLYATIDVTNPEKSNKIYFEAIRNIGGSGIALDDIKILLGNCPEINECDFEEVDICGFEQGTTDKFNWTRGNYRTAQRHGPTIDHTYKSIFGHYMYLNMKDHAKDDHAHLYTPQYPVTQTENCLSFWYYMYGTFADKLNVYLYQNNKITSKLWFVQENQGPFWRLATVSINSQTPFQVLFEGIRGHNSYVTIALDDVKVSRIACNPLASCNFEDGYCGWFNNHLTIGHHLNWVIRTGHYRTQTTPRFDHTIGDYSGSYLLIESSNRNAGKTAYLESQMVPYEESPRFCFHFWYYMYGADVGSLIVYIHYHGRSLNSIWMKNSSANHLWNEKYVSVGNPYLNFEIVIGSIAGRNGSIAVDDVVLMKGVCPNVTANMFVCKSGLKIPSKKECDFIFDCPDGDDEVNCGSCTFEDDMCTWKDQSHGSFEWDRGRNGNNLTESGPSTDHTLGSNQGWFAYIHSSNRTSTVYANLENRPIQQTSSTCELNFWYHISSRRIFNQIRLELLEGDSSTTIFSVTKQTNRWKKATVALGKISRPFYLQFYGTRTLSELGDVAIDDITLNDCNFPRPQNSCEENEFHCDNKACIDSSEICDLSNDCGDSSDERNCDKFNGCDFDFGLCDWSQDWNDDFEWIRTNGETLSYSTGPKRDHSTGTATGYYIYTESSFPRKKGDKARLYSPVIEPATDDDCWIRFFYHMNGFQMGTLNVYTRTSVLGNYKTLWTKSGHVADYWERADVQLKSPQKFQVVFESIVGGFSSDIALDDISFLPGCNILETKEKLSNGSIAGTTPNPLHCSIGLYPCKDKSGCVQYSNLCDFENNCGDNSDEEICGDCDFQSGLCGWQDNSTGQFKWASHQGDAMGRIGPKKDHTTKSIKGKYMRVFPNNGIYRTAAIMNTPPYGETGKNCRIEFYVFFSGLDIGVLNLNIINPTNGAILKTLISLKSNLGNNWSKESAVIGARKRGFSLQFQSRPQTDSGPFRIETDIAVDDVKLIDCNPAPIKSFSTTKPTPRKHSTTNRMVKSSTGSPVSKKTTPTIPTTSTTHRHSVYTKLPEKTTTKTHPVISTQINQHTNSKYSTARTATTEIPNLCGFGKFSCQTNVGLVCLPAAYLCDDKKDCLNGVDESSCKICQKNYTYCKPQQKCMKLTRCNGISECSDGSDESACNKCREDFCQRGGTCYLENGIPTCRCGNVTELVNFRCIILKTEKHTQANQKKTWAIPVGIILALVMVGALVFGIHTFWKRRTQRNYSPSLNAGIDNPIYNYDLKMTEFEPPSFSNKEMQGDSTAIENPLYSDLN